MKSLPDIILRVKKHPNCLIGLIIILILSPYLALFAFGSDTNLIGFFPDDAFYYLKTARNVFVAGFATFDGIHPTNGFHPLYFVLVTGLAGLIPFAWFLKGVFLFHALTMWLAIFLLLKPRQQENLKWRIFIAAIFASPAPFLFVWLSAGMEASLVVLCTVLLLNALNTAYESEFNRVKSNWWLSATMALFMLSRLDLVVSLIPIVIWILYVLLNVKGEAKNKVKNLAYLFTIPFLSGAGYVIFNVVTTGHVMPVSAAVKHLFTSPFSSSWLASTGNGNWVLSALALTPVLISILALADHAINRKNNAGVKSYAMHSLVAVSILLYYAYLVLYASNFFRWYFAMPMAASAWIAANWLIQNTTRLRISETAALLTGFLLILLAFASNAIFVRTISLSSKSVSSHLIQIAKALESNTQPCEVAAVFDAGIIGYFSNRTVINLDGLANNYSYLNNFRSKGRVSAYLDQEQVNVLLIRGELLDNLPEVASGTYQFAQFTDDKKLKLKQQDELFRHEIPGTFTLFAYRYHAMSENNKATQADGISVQPCATKLKP